MDILQLMPRANILIQVELLKKSHVHTEHTMPMVLVPALKLPMMVK